MLKVPIQNLNQTFPQSEEESPAPFTSWLTEKVFVYLNHEN